MIFDFCDDTQAEKYLAELTVTFEKQNYRPDIFINPFLDVKELLKTAQNVFSLTYFQVVTVFDYWQKNIKMTEEEKEEAYWTVAITSSYRYKGGDVESFFDADPKRWNTFALDCNLYDHEVACKNVVKAMEEIEAQQEDEE